MSMWVWVALAAVVAYFLFLRKGKKPSVPGL